MSHVDDGALHAYLDGEVTAAERAAIDAHLAGCPACQTRLGEEQALARRAGELLSRAQPPLPERAAPPLQSIRSRRRARRWVLPLTWAATVVLAVGLGYSLREPEPAAPVPIADQSLPAQPAPAPAEKSGIARPPAAEPEPRADLAARRDTGRDSGFAETPAAALAVRDQPQAVLRSATPRDAANFPAPAAALGVERRAEAGVAPARSRLVTTEWPVIQRNSARELLGTEPVGVPGLAVRQLRTSPENDGTVLIEQAVDATTVIQLYQRRSERERDLRRDGTTERLARFIDGLRVEIAGPLSQDSLNRLLEQLQPLP